jgi:DNA polymerase III subunit beta
VIYLLQDRVAFELGSVTLVTKLLQGDYPNVEQVIPAKCEVEVNLHREELISLLRQVVLFTSDTSQSAKFQFQEGELTLSANTMDVGEGKVSMPANFSGKAIEIAFNPHFVLDVLRRSDDETCTFGLSDSYNPGVIRDTSEGVFVIMPMRLSETA